MDDFHVIFKDVLLNRLPWIKTNAIVLGFFSLDMASILPHKLLQNKYPDQPHNANDRFHDRPGAEGILYREVEVFLIEPKTAVVDVG